MRLSYRLLATGDLYLTRPIVRDRRSSLAHIWRRFHEADDVLVNLEVCLTEETSRADKSCLKADPSLAQDLKAAGITIVNLANNHVMDYGHRGLDDTIAVVGSVGIAIVGAGQNVHRALKPSIHTSKEGHRIAFIGVSCLLPPGAAATLFRPGIAPLRVISRFVMDPELLAEQPGTSPFVETFALDEDVELVTSAIRAAKANADAVVLSIHWGLEIGSTAPFLQGEVATYQQPLAHVLVDAGADAIVGNHPHVLQGVEIYRERPIFYSLGNLLFHSEILEGGLQPYPGYTLKSPYGDRDRMGVIACLTWPSGQDSGPQVALWPICRDKHGEPAFARPAQANRILAELNGQSAGFGARFDMEDLTIRLRQ